MNAFLFVEVCEMKKKLMSSRIALAYLPTPLEEIKAMFVPHDLEIWFKRDDLTEFVGSGNKIRKLEYLLYEAQQNGSNTIVTCGGIQSNHCRATAFAARKLGMKPVLFLRGTKPEHAEGNLFLDELLESEIHWITPEQYQERDRIMSEYCENTRNPEQVYLIPEGGSNMIGSLGYMRAIDEMMQQVQLDSFDAVFCPVGSGGTYAGLLAGLKSNNVATPLIGINVTLTNPSEFTAKVKSICDELVDNQFLKNAVDEKDITILDGYCGEAYAVPTQKGIDYIKNCLLQTGILLDPVYTSKSFDGLLEESKKRGFKKVLFIHTGGGFGNYAYSDRFGV